MMSIHIQEYRFQKEWGSSQTDLNIIYLNDIKGHLQTFVTQAETRDAALYAGVRNRIRAAIDNIDQALALYQEEETP